MKPSIEARGSPEGYLLKMILDNKILEASTSIGPEPYAIYFQGVRGDCVQCAETQSYGNHAEAQTVGSAIEISLSSNWSNGYRLFRLNASLPSCATQEKWLVPISVWSHRAICKLNWFAIDWLFQMNYSRKLEPLKSFKTSSETSFWCRQLNRIRLRMPTMVIWNSFSVQILRTLPYLVPGEWRCISYRKIVLLISFYFRALLVIFGNPDVLKNDVNWRKIIQRCATNGTYFGCD